MSLNARLRRHLSAGVLLVAAPWAWAQEPSLAPSPEPDEAAELVVSGAVVEAGAALPQVPSPDTAAEAQPAAPAASTPDPADAGVAPQSASTAPDPAATAEPTAAAPAADAAPAPVTRRLKRDPFEPFNRSMHAFNEAVDSAALRPLAEGYRRVLPELVRTGVDNFFGNLADAWSAVNKLLQGKVMASAQMTLRVATNSVFGLGGVLDPATEFGLERQPEDFGQTLGVWGVPTGPYLVLPVLGPSTVRDTAALPLDRGLASPTRFVGHGTNAAIGLTGVQLVSARAGLLTATRLFNDVALDKYGFLRDAYLARRRSQLYDGNPPDDEDTPDPR